MRRLIACLPVLLWTIFAAAQERPPVGASPGKPPAALARLAGDWKARATFWKWKDPSGPLMECTATIRAKIIMGGRFLLQNVEGHCTDQPVEAIGVIGYDNATGRYEAASFDNMGTRISRHVGEMNDAGDIVLHSTYQDQITGEKVDRRTVRTMISAREWLETAYETRNGDERKVMEIRAQRIDGAVPQRP
jgi:hypothetical protein